MEFRPHPYQSRAVRFIEDHPFCALFLDMGLGKTVSTLTALDNLSEALEIEKILVIAPKSVARNTWSTETDKWDHTRHIRLSIVMGTAVQRKKALEKAAIVYVTNRDNITWLVGEYIDNNKPWPFDCVVVDESSSFKNFKSKRFKSLWKVRPFVRRMILLTGTPAPNGLMDLWSQIKLLDRGERLGHFIGQYRDAYFHPGARNGSVIYEYLPNPGAREKISAKLGDICLSMQAADYLQMPSIIDGGMELRMEPSDLEQYRRFEKDCVLTIEDGARLEAVTAVALTNKLLQFSSGAVYDSEHTWHPVCTEKIDALNDIIDTSSEPLLVYYNYQHELERIKAEHPEAIQFKGEPDILRQWNAGQIPLMLAHPASVAYGLNMQEGGHIIIWYSPTWNLELYQQANARLNRQGQTKPVIIYHLICKGTMDEAVVNSLKRKDDTQNELMKQIKQLREYYGSK